MDKEQENYERLEKATDKMKDITKNNPNHFKTQRLGNGMSNYTNQLERDIKGIRRRNPVFKHGTLVYVDFGINYGSEFSSYHYAITLNKNDNKRNNTITVVPLTSKKGLYNLRLTSSITVNLAQITQAYIDEQNKLIKECPKLEKDIKAIEETIAKAEERINKYKQDLEKDTFIKMDAITTIDKNKIFKRKDNLDPLTKVVVPKETLRFIESYIKHLFFTDN